MHPHSRISDPRRIVTAQRRARGFTLLGLLFLVAGLGVALAALGTAWQNQVRREKEAELLFVGDQYRQAIQSFHLRAPGEKRYPKALQELLLDPRFPQPVRHLRRLYQDPLGAGEWGLITAPDGGIMGVYSRSTAVPLKSAGFPPAYQDFAGKPGYRDWQFVHTAATAPAAALGTR